MKRIHRIAHALPAVGVVLTSASVARAAGGGELNLIPHLPTVVILVIGFVLLVPLVNAIIVKPVFAVLDERADRIAGARKRAEALEESASEVLARYETSVREVREESEAGRRQQLDAARAEQAQITAQARSDAEREIGQSRTEVGESLASARADLRQAAEQLARQAAEQILGRPV